MAECATCGNEYDKTFRVVTAAGESYEFDSFECAIQELAPRCGNCGVRIVGHGIEVEGSGYYCCGHCASAAGHEEPRDRV